jgi:cytochrome c peroxidase
MRGRIIMVVTVGLLVLGAMAASRAKNTSRQTSQFLGSAEDNSARLIQQGREIFRFDTFGDEAFWGGQLQLHQAINTLTPRQALALGLKVDTDALSPSLVEAIKHGKINLDDPAVTRTLIQQKAVLGVVGFFDNSNMLRSVGLTCAVCHSTVDDSVAPGIGARIDGLTNRDLNVGAIAAAAPNLEPVVNLLSLADAGITAADVRAVLNSWGPGKFDAELFLDGKAFNPQQITNGVVTGRNVSGATLIPNARGLSGHNLHTWTGGWGTVTYWNAFVAVNELHGTGTFFDERFDNAAQFPIAAKAGLGHVSTDPDSDRVTSKLPALHFYQLALPAVQPRPGIDFDPDAAERGDGLFSGKAKCNTCHREPLWTEPGWNQHSADEMKIDSFEADRAPASINAAGEPTHGYRTMNLAGVFVRERGLFMNPQNRGHFYHDGRFLTLLDTVKSYNARFNLGLSDQEEHDLVEYLKSL